MCIPSESDDSVCLHFDSNTFIGQPKYVSLRPFLILGDNQENRVTLGTLDLVLTNDKHLTKEKTYQSNDYRKLQDFTDAIQSNEFGKYGDKPIVQYLNPSNYQSISENNYDAYHSENNNAGYHGNDDGSSYRGNAYDSTLYYKNNVNKNPGYHGNSIDGRQLLSDSYRHSNDVNKSPDFHDPSFDNARSKSPAIKSDESKNGGWIPSNGYNG